jgi:SPP1 gp7 family putative phage head morphogenesis protein
MKNSVYWRERFKILESVTNEKTQEYLQTLNREYLAAETRIEKEIYHWFQRFAQNNRVSMADAKRMLGASELEELKWSIGEYVKYAEQNALDGKWVKQLENASAKAHISRLEALKLNVRQNIEEFYASKNKSLIEHIRGVYDDRYYRTAYEVQKGVGVGTSFSKIDATALDNVIKKPWTTDNRTFSDRIWKYKKELNDKVQTELAQMLMSGDAPDKAIENIANAFKVSRAHAGNLVMTESAFFASASESASYKELGVKRYEIVATLDAHTSEKCREMDGKFYLLSEYIVGDTAPPFHCRCRSTTAPYFDDDGEDATRIARGEDGKTYTVPADMTYKEWRGKHVDGYEVQEQK